MHKKENDIFWETITNEMIYTMRPRIEIKIERPTKNKNIASITYANNYGPLSGKITTILWKKDMEGIWIENKEVEDEIWF